MARAIATRWRAGELVRVAVEELLGRGELDAGQDALHARLALVAVPEVLDVEGLGDDAADGHPGVERLVRVMEDHLGLPPEIAAVHLGQVDLPAVHPETDLPARRLGQSQEEPAERRLA
jgi:hypothetical protein